MTATDPDGLTATQSAAVAVQRPNRAPEAVGSIPAQSLAPGRTVTVDVSGYFRDPDGDALTYTAATSNAGVASVSISGSSLTVTGVAEGRATVTVTAADPGGLTAAQSAAVTVQQSNRAPQAVGSIPAQSLDAGGRVTLDVSSYFRDPDGDTLTYTAMASNAGVASVSMSGSRLTVVGLRSGSANVQVTAADPAGLTATQNVGVTVRRRSGGGGFGDGFDDPSSLNDWNVRNANAEVVGGVLHLTNRVSGSLGLAERSSPPTLNQWSVSARVGRATRQASPGVASLTGHRRFSAVRLVLRTLDNGSDAGPSADVAGTMTVTGRGGVAADVAVSASGGGTGTNYELAIFDAERGWLQITNLSGRSDAVDERANAFTDIELGLDDGDFVAHARRSETGESATLFRVGLTATLENVPLGDILGEMNGFWLVNQGPVNGTIHIDDIVATGEVTSNRAPRAVGSIPAQRLNPGQARTIDVSGYFRDPDGDALAYRVSSSSPAVAGVGISGSIVTVAGGAPGRATVTVTASDPAGLTATQTIAVTVQTGNRAPVAVGSIPAESLNPRQVRTIDVSSYFRDPDGNALTYTAASSNTGVATASVSGSSVTVTGVAAGSATVTVTARDPAGLTATQTIAVTVQTGNRAPVAVGSIPAESLNPGQAQTIDVSSYFRDPDGNALTYTAASSNTGVATASVSGSSVTVTGVAVGSATVTVTASDPSGLTATQTIAVSVQVGNRAPVPVGSIPAQGLEPSQTRTVDVSSYFRDPDGDALTYAASSSNTGVATTAVSGSSVSVSGVAVGSATVRVTASDPSGLSATQTFAVTVQVGNRAPVPVGSIPAQSLEPSQTRTVDVSSYFRDPDGDALTYAVSSSNTGAATASVSGSSVTVTGVADGSATVTVTASDPDGLSATQTIAVTVQTPNRAPEAVGSIPNQSLKLGQTRTIDVSGYFQDPDGDALTYRWARVAPAFVVRATMSGSNLTVTGVGLGSTAVTVRATDPAGLEADQTISVEVTDGATRLTSNSAGDTGPVWSPDGTKIAFLSNRSNPWRTPNKIDVYVMNADGSGVTRLSVSNDGGRAYDPVWSPDGSKVAWAGDSVVPDGETEIVWKNADGSGAGFQITRRGGGSPAWSPDGAKIAFTSDRDGHSNIYVIDPLRDERSTVRLTHASSDFQPVWSPDGAKIAFMSGRDGQHEIYVMNADGSGETRLTNHGAEEKWANWSPDGTKIAFTSTRGGRESIFVMNADGSRVTRLTSASHSDSRASWSPDGTRIAFSSYRPDDELGRYGVYVINADGSGETRLTAGFRDAGPKWSPDGTKIAFSSFRDEWFQIYLVEVPAADSSAALGAELPGDAPERPAFEVTPPRR
ncbi:MAG: Ig-like domain-containing protein [Gemmatimonadetes bacterium]|nr:Ig-like domain-containing protein [Gemmatimonadota bacterium]